MFIQKPFIYKPGGNRRPIFGIGINDADYPVSYTDDHGKFQRCPYYSVWVGIVERCYSSKFHARRPTYVGCTLQEEWKVFSVFRAWMQSQDWRGKAIDKDLLAQGSKHYGPATCLFISHGLNNLLTLRNNHRGKWPLGVSTTRKRGRQYFIADCSFYGKQTRLGQFSTPEQAAARYSEAKRAHIAELATREIDPRVKRALLNLY